MQRPRDKQEQNLTRKCVVSCNIMDGKLSRTLLRRIFDSFSTTVLRRRSVPRVSSALCDGNRSLGNRSWSAGVSGESRALLPRDQPFSEITSSRPKLRRYLLSMKKVTHVVGAECWKMEIVRRSEAFRLQAGPCTSLIQR